MNDTQPISELTDRRLLSKNRYILFHDRLVYEWDYKTGNKGKVHYLLSSLSSDIYIQRTFGHGACSSFRYGLFLLALGVAVFTSEYHKQIPLLAPILWFFGAGPFASACLKLRESHFSTIQRSDGTRLISIYHKGCAKDERERFEALFSQTVKEQVISSTKVDHISEV